MAEIAYCFALSLVVVLWWNARTQAVIAKAEWQKVAALGPLIAKAKYRRWLAARKEYAYATTGFLINIFVFAAFLLKH